MQDLNWNSLQFVLALARQGSLERAARGLGVDPSTVSRTIRALEGDVGARIFDRTLAGHRPTEVGRRVVEAAERVEANILAMRRLADRADERLEGLIRVVTSEAVAGRLAAHLSRFRQRHPLVSFEILTGPSSALLGRREADLSIQLSRPAQLQLASRRITTLGFGLYASPGYLADHPFNGEQPTLGHQLLGYHLGLNRLPESQWLDPQGGEAQFALRTSSVDSMLTAAASGLGLAVLPCFLADAEPRLVRLLGPDQVFTKEVWLVVHRDSRRVARLRAFTDFIVEALLDQAPQLQGALLATG